MPATAIAIVSSSPWSPTLPSPQKRTKVPSPKIADNNTRCNKRVLAIAGVVTLNNEVRASIAADTNREGAT